MGLEDEPRLIIPPEKSVAINPVALRQVPPGKTFVPTERREGVLAWGHASRLAGHQGPKRTGELIERQYWWSTLRADVRAYVQGCVSCARNKPSRQRPAGLLVPLPVPGGPWQDIAMDFVTGLPPSEGNTVIWVVADQFTRMCHLVALPGLPSARRLADLFFRHVFRLHGLPRRIVSDRGVQFTARFWGELCRLLEVEVDLSSAYHPQTNGLAERTNQSLQVYLRHFISGRHDDWSELLAWAEFAANNAVADATGQTPFFAQSGTHPRMPLPFPVTSEMPAVADFTAHLQEVWAQTQRSLRVSKERMKGQADRRRRPAPEFSPGDLVWLSSRFVRLRVASLKFAPRYLGPFKVISRVGPVTYKIRLPLSWRVCNSFHVSLLKPMVLNRFSPPVREEPEQVEGDFEVREIVASRTVRGRKFYLVDWVGYGPEERSWEPVENINAPDLIAEFEGRGGPEGGGTVRRATRWRAAGGLSTRRPLVADDGERPSTSQSVPPPRRSQRLRAQAPPAGGSVERAKSSQAPTAQVGALGTKSGRSPTAQVRAPDAKCRERHPAHAQTRGVPLDEDRALVVTRPAARRVTAARQTCQAQEYK